MFEWSSDTTNYLLDSPDATNKELIDFFIKGYTECHQALMRGEDTSDIEVIKKALGQYFKEGVINE